MQQFGNINHTELPPSSATPPRAELPESPTEFGSRNIANDVVVALR
jgi:hypothetical protein